jgi:CRP/FNR family transcriptional regulator, cyclic AMP receptor protein
VSQTADHMFESEILDGLSERVLADLGGRFGASRFGKGELIYSPFDRADAMYVVQTGRVRLYRSAHDGRQLTLAMLDEGEVFGRVSPEGEALHDAYAEAMTDAVVRVLPTADLERATAEHPQMALNLLRSLSERLRSTEDQLENLAFRGVPARLAAQLLQLMDRYGRVTHTGIRIDERFTHVQLAEMIGTSRETLTKVMNELREGGLIDVRDRLVWVLDPDGLERLRGSG